MQKRTWAGVALVVGALAAGGGWWALRAQANGQADKPADRPLRFTATEVAPPRALALPQVVTLSGPLVAPRTATVRSRSGGTLLAWDVAEGDRVQAGQRLARVDMAELGARQAESQAALAAAQAQLAQAQRTHTTNSQLAQAKFIAPTVLEGSALAMDAARASVSGAQAQLAAVQVAMRESVVTAPFTGIVAKLSAQAGERVAPEQALITVVDLTRLELAATVGVQEVGALEPGQAVRVQVDGVRGERGRIAGEIDRIAPAAEPGSRAIGVTVRLPNPGERLRAGQFATATLTLAPSQTQLTVPLDAVSSASGQSYVWVIEAGHLMRRAITTGQRDEHQGRVEVLSGLTANAQVLQMRFDNLREGALAQVGASGASPAASAARPQRAPAPASVARV